jgi:hypothetical protein
VSIAAFQEEFCYFPMCRSDLVRRRHAVVNKMQQYVTLCIWRSSGNRLKQLRVVR